MTFYQNLGIIRHLKKPVVAPTSIYGEDLTFVIGKLTLIITELGKVYFGPKGEASDEYYAEAWGDWMFTVTYFRKVYILQSHVLLVALAPYDPRELSWEPHREGLFLAPIPVVVVQLTYLLDHVSVTSVWVPCSYCERVYQLIPNERYFHKTTEIILELLGKHGLGCMAFRSR